MGDNKFLRNVNEINYNNESEENDQSQQFRNIKLFNSQTFGIHHSNLSSSQSQSQEEIININFRRVSQSKTLVSDFTENNQDKKPTLITDELKSFKGLLKNINENSLRLIKPQRNEYNPRKSDSKGQMFTAPTSNREAQQTRKFFGGDQEKSRPSTSRFLSDFDIQKVY
jgi:hypothetical protein